MGLTAARPPAPRLDRRVGRESVGDATGRRPRSTSWRTRGAPPPTRTRPRLHVPCHPEVRDVPSGSDFDALPFTSRYRGQMAAYVKSNAATGVRALA
jgi:hypothetical protein